MHLAVTRMASNGNVAVTYIMAVGIAKTLDKAIKIASSGLLEWLQKDFHITLQEATQVMSTTIEYTIAEIADPEVVV